MKMKPAPSPPHSPPPHGPLPPLSSAYRRIRRRRGPVPLPVAAVCFSSSPTAAERGIDAPTERGVRVQGRARRRSDPGHTRVASRLLALVTCLVVIPVVRGVSAVRGGCGSRARQPHRQARSAPCLGPPGLSELAPSGDAAGPAAGASVDPVRPV